MTKTKRLKKKNKKIFKKPIPFSRKSRYNMTISKEETKLMNRIDLTKYGFVRSPQDDFSDDGTRFTCYRVGDVRVSKAVWQDQVFIAGRYEGPDSYLEYEEASLLPHDSAMNKLNGVSKAGLQESDVKAFYEACVAYDKEYKEAVSKIVWPDQAEIAGVRKSVRLARQAELAKIDEAAAKDVGKLLSLKDSDLKRLAYCRGNVARMAKPDGSDEEYAASIAHTRFGRGYVMPASVDRELKESWYYKEAMEILTEAGLA